MERYEVEVAVREETGKGAARRLREQGKIPGVVYGKNREPQSLIVDPHDIANKVNSNAIFDLKIMEDEDGSAEKEAEVTMIKDFQKDVIKGNIIHVDFQQISMDETITIDVPLNLVGESFGVKEGGVMQQLMREVSIEVLPSDIPEELDLDVSELDVGDSLQVGDLEVDEGIKLVDALDEVIVTIVTPSEEIEEEEELEEEFVEPEVIGEEEELEEEILEDEEEVEEEEEEEGTPDYMQ